MDYTIKDMALGLGLTDKAVKNRLSRLGFQPSRLVEQTNSRGLSFKEGFYSAEDFETLRLSIKPKKEKKMKVVGRRNLGNVVVGTSVDYSLVVIDEESCEPCAGAELELVEVVGGLFVEPEKVITDIDGRATVKIYLKEDASGACSFGFNIKKPEESRVKQIKDLTLKWTEFIDAIPGLSEDGIRDQDFVTKTKDLISSLEEFVE